MNILHAAVAVVVPGAESQILAHPQIPQLGNIGSLQVPFDQLLLDLVTQQDMGRIGHLIGIDPDVAWRDPRIDTCQIFTAKCRLSAKALADQRGDAGHEGWMARHLHLEEQALALMDTHGTGLADRER